MLCFSSSSVLWYNLVHMYAWICIAMKPQTSGWVSLPSSNSGDMTSNHIQSKVSLWRLAWGQETMREKSHRSLTSVLEISLSTSDIIWKLLEYFKTFFEIKTMQHLVNEPNLYTIQVRTTSLSTWIMMNWSIVLFLFLHDYDQNQ